MGQCKLQKDDVQLLVVDVQEKLFRLVDRPCDTLAALQKVIKGFQAMRLPIQITEQYPEGLGETVFKVKSCLPEGVTPLTKTTFSCFGDENVEKALMSSGRKQWVVVGIEAHVCILQTVKDLIERGQEVVVLNDAITSRSIFDYSTAIAEIRDCGARISCVEAVLFELVHDAKAPEFKEISALVK